MKIIKKLNHVKALYGAKTTKELINKCINANNFLKNFSIKK